MKHRAPLNWPAEPTLRMLEYMHPTLFRQCVRVFGRRRAGQIVFALTLRKREKDK